nr:unnamed protein product [Digitaria exilis]
MPGRNSGSSGARGGAERPAWGWEDTDFLEGRGGGGFLAMKPLRPTSPPGKPPVRPRSSFSKASRSTAGWAASVGVESVEDAGDEEVVVVDGGGEEAKATAA